MSRDKEYEALFSKYNCLVARANDLQEQLNTKKRQYKEEEAKWNKTEDLIRSLCILILANDRNEMVLGEDYSWGSVETNELIHKSSHAFKEYKEKRTDLLNKLMDLAEDRREKIESLQDQISRFIMGKSKIEDVASAQEAIEKVEEEIEKEKFIKKGAEKTPYAVKTAAQEGKVELIIEESNEIEIDGEMQLIDDLIAKSEQAKITSRSIPITQSRGKKKNIEQKKHEKSMVHMIDLNEYLDRMNDCMWDIVQVIGESGISKWPEIEHTILNKFTERRKTKVRTSVLELHKMGVVHQETLNLPLVPKMFVYRLTDIGSRLYKQHFNKEAIVSEVEKIIAEHDNVEHGYGIVAIQNILEEAGKYDKVESFNRKNAIKIKDGKKYIPDLICYFGKRVDYIEYERGLHTQTDFNAKCNKMTQVTRFLNFVVPNKTVLEKRLALQIRRWIESRGDKSLKNIKVRVTTASALKEFALEDDKCWLLVYDFNKGQTPIKEPL